MIKSLYKPFQKWSEHGSIWIFSDPHFNDEDLNNAYEDRPSADELVCRINSKVGKYDTLICLGDVGDISYVRHLRGYKVLITGNHDAGATTYERRIDVVREHCENYTEEEMLRLVEKRFPNCDHHITMEFCPMSSVSRAWEIRIDNKLFDEVYDGPLFISPKLLLSHEPIYGMNFTMNIHGHIHDRAHENDNYHYNVCADCHNYLPLNLNQFLKSGALSNITSLHRLTIDNAIARSKN